MTNKIDSAVRLALALALILPSASMAAEDTGTGSDALEEVTVVGSRIRRDTFSTPSPITVITREEVTSAGFGSTTEALQSASVTAGSSQINNAYGGFVTDGGPGANTLSLRSLGAARTLVLINGRRVAPAGTRGAIGSADLNVLPNAMVDRIEVLKDGASSVYGSDAIAGVVNVITRSDVPRLTVEAQYNRPFDGGGEQGRFSVVGGLGGERWNLTGSAEYYTRGNLTLADREWTRCNTDSLRDPDTGESLDFIDPLTGEPKCYPITFTGSNGVTINTVGTPTRPGVGAAGSVGTSFNRWRPNSGVTTGVVGFEGVGGGANSLGVRDTFEPRALDENLISPAKVWTGFVQGGYELNALGDAEIYGEFLINRRESEQQGYRQLSLDYRLGSILIPANLTFPTQFLPPQNTTGTDPVGVRAFIGFGLDQNSQAVDYYKPTIGIRGELAFLDGWRYDAYVSYAKSDAEYTFQAALIDKLTKASDAVASPVGLDPALNFGGVTCRVNLTTPSEACVPYPRLTAQTIGGVLPQSFRDYIWYDVTGKTEYSEWIASSVVDGPLFDLPYGTLQGVFGAEFRRAEINDQPDPASVAGNLYNFTSSQPTVGDDSVWEVFAEIEAPLLRDLPGAKELTFNASYRFTDYDSYGSGDTYRLGLVYAPIQWVSLRGTYGTSFRAPALFEQFQGATTGFLSSANDPCNDYGSKSPTRAANCATQIPNPAFQQTQGITVFSEGGAAAGLEAETSKNSTVGIIIEPPVGERNSLSLAVDWFDIRVDNGVSQPGASNIMTRCYDDPNFDPNGGFCRLLTREAATPYRLTVSNAYTNIATEISRGFDYTLRYEMEVGPGKFLVSGVATQYLKQANKLFEDEELTDFNGQIQTPEWAASLDLTYTQGRWQGRYGVDWIDSMDSYEYLEEDPATSQFDFRTSSYLTHYASVRYRNEGWDVTAGVRNLFDEEPPTISAGYYNRVGNAPLYSGFDYVGRTAFLVVSKEF